jgi:hypothetical protein
MIAIYHRATHSTYQLPFQHSGDYCSLTMLLKAKTKSTIGVAVPGKTS